MNRHASKILVVDDEKEICGILSRVIMEQGFEPIVANNGETALRIIQIESPEVVLSDIRMSGMDGMELLTKTKALDPDLPFVLITGYADIPGAVLAMKGGAHDYLSKPFDHLEVIRVVHRALAERGLKRRIRHLSDQAEQVRSLGEMMGPSVVVRQVVAEVNRVATSGFTVIIVGETGSGKELIAQAIHRASHRSGGPFVAIDCGAIPSNLLESELFGHEKGAFTGAVLQKPGKFEVGKGGTLFLDEISNMPLESQAKLLRVLQEKKVYRVGGTRPYEIDVRLLVAANRNLEVAVGAGLFRQDLFYRINEFTIKIPPLRERREDILYLAKRFLGGANVELGKNVRGFSDSALHALLVHDWAGNARQLRSAIRRAALLADEIVTEKHLDVSHAPAAVLPSEPHKTERIPWLGQPFKEIMRHRTVEVERVVLSEALESTGGNKAKAARLLHIDYKTIHTKIKKLGISTRGGGREYEEQQKDPDL
jgi:two-component system nitrogen regulation response regulator GlnG